jgi:hypothetical protein
MQSAILYAKWICRGHLREGTLDNARNKSQEATGVSRNEMLDERALQAQRLARQWTQFEKSVKLDLRDFSNT